MNEPTPENHLAHIREQVALLVARLEPAAGDEPPIPDAETLALANLLLRRITHAEQAMADDAESAAALRRIDAQYRQSMRRIDEAHDRLADSPPAHAPEPDRHAPSSGSVIGDAVRDSFLNMG